MSDAIIPSAAPAEVNVTPSGATPPAAAPTQDWYSSFNDDMKGYVQNKGFKDPAAVVDSYRNLEKLMGAPKERLLKLPEKDDSPEWNDIYSKLGKPSKPEEYNFKLGNESDFKWAQQAFHEAGLTAKQAAALAEKWTGYQESSMKGQQEQFNQKIEQETVGLKKEWGMAYDKNIEQAKRAVSALGVPGEAIDALEKSIGFSAVMKMMHGLGSKLGEDSFVSGQNKQNFGAMTPESAQNRITSLRGDPAFVQKYVAGDVSAREEMEKLHRWAYPDAN